MKGGHAQCARRPHRLQGRRDVHRWAGGYAMNMRAAEANVSKPPKAMKIFPIREV
jgi:hypothetical protein